MGLDDLGGSKDGEKWQFNYILQVELTALGKGLDVRAERLPSCETYK